MFKKLKDKIAEEISPQRIQQFTQSVTDKLQNNTNDENLFSIAEDDSSDMPATHNDTQHGFQSISLHAATASERLRRNSNSSIASDVSFLPRYESNTNMYHLQSDLDVSASEIEDNASTSSGLGNVSKEQVYSAFQKAQMRYHKYRGRYTDLANHYKELERENGKMKAVLVETQDKAIRRVSELREQCNLSQRAKADLEQALRTEIEEKLIIIGTLRDKVDFLQNVGENSESNTMSNSTSISSFSEHSSGNLEQLTKYLNEARQEIENLNTKMQELKANAIVHQSKEVDFKQKIANIEKVLSEKTREFEERERETNIKFAKSKLELHTEIQNKDLEIGNLKKDVETLRTDLDSYENRLNTTNLQNLKTQNGKLIDKCESLQVKCNNFEAEMLKIEQLKQEIAKLQSEQSENRVAEIKIAELESQIAELNQNADSVGLKQEIFELKAKNDAQCDEIRELSNNFVEIEKANSMLRNSLDEKCKEIGVFEATADENAQNKIDLQENKMILDVLQAELDESSEKFEACSAELVQSRTKYADCLTTLATNESVLLEAKSKLADFKKCCTELFDCKAKLDERNRELSDLTAKVAKYQLVVSDCKAEVLKLNERNAELIKCNSERETEIVGLKANLEDYKIKTDQSMEENVRLKRESEENCSKIQEETKQSLLSLETKIKEKIQSDFNAKEQKMKQDFEKKLTDLTANSDSIKDTQIKLMQSADLVEELELKLKEVSADFDRKSISYTELETNHLDLIAENNANSVEIGQLMKEINNYTKVESEMTKYRSESKYFEDENLQLKNEIQALKDASALLGDEMKRLMGQANTIKDFEQKLKKELESKKVFEDENSRLNKQVLQQINIFKELQEEKLALQQELTDSQSKLQLLGSLKNENESLRKQIDHLLVSLEEKDGRVVELDVKLKQIGSPEKLKEENVALQEQISDLQSENVSLREQVDDSICNLDDRETTIFELKGELAVLKVEMVTLEQKFVDLVAKNEDLLAANSKLEDKIGYMDECKIGLEKQLADERISTQEITKLVRENDDLKTDKNQLEVQNGSLTEKTLALEASIAKLNEDIVKVKESMHVLTETNVKLEKSNSNLSKQMEQESKKLATDSEKHLKDSETLLQQIETCEKSELAHKTELERFKTKLVDSNTKLDQLKDYETKYKNMLDENQNLKEQLPQIEELKAKILILDHVQNELSNVRKALDRVRKELDATKKDLDVVKKENFGLAKKLSTLEAELAEKVTETRKLRQEIVELKILKDDLDGTQNENLKLINEIGEVRAQLNMVVDQKQELVQRLEQMRSFESLYNENLQSTDAVDVKIKELKDEVIELTSKNFSCNSDNRRLLDENERLISDFEGLKLKHEQFDATKLSLESKLIIASQENVEMSQKLAQSNAELEGLRIQKDSLQQLQTSAQNTSENGTNLLQSKITELREMNEKFEAAFNESKSTKSELLATVARLEVSSKEKTDLSLQLANLEHHYSEISHEKQLLLDEIQELKISPLNLNGDAHAGVPEVEALREKIRSYKSLDAANRNSIDFYEDELQKMRVKNEKLNRKLDETLVTLNHCADLTGNGMEVEYLKNVLYNYMLGKESLVMARVLTAVCKFDKDQTDAVLKNEQHKQSLLGQLGIL